MKQNCTSLTKSQKSIIYGDTDGKHLQLHWTLRYDLKVLKEGYQSSIHLQWPQFE